MSSLEFSRAITPGGPVNTPRRRAPITFFLLASSIFALGQDTTGAGRISVRVLDASGAAIAGEQVCVMELDRCLPSDDSGQVRFEQLRAGQYHLRMEGAGDQLESVEVEVRAGLDAHVDIRMPALRETITVTATESAITEEIKNSGYLFSGPEIFKSAGTLQDVARFVQTLPGVAIGSDDFRNDIIVRGGSPLENLFIVDNVEVPNINTFANFASAGGTVSILDPNMIRDVTFLTGGYPAPYGNRTSSVLQIAQREGDREAIRGRANVLFGGAGGLLEGPIKKSKGSWVVSARRSFLDLFTRDTGIGGVPVLTTFNAKALYDLTPRDRIWLVNLTGLDNIRLGLTDENRNDTDELINNFDIRYRGRRSATGFNWQRLWGTRVVGLLGLTHSQAGVDSSVRDLLRDGLPPPDGSVDDIIAGSPQVFREDSGESETTLKYDLTWEFSPVTRVQAGGSVKMFRIRYDTASPFGNDSPYSLTPGLGAFALKRTFRTDQESGYAQLTRQAGRWNLTLGGRLDRYGYLGQTRVSPRAGVRFQVTPRLSWSASYGHYYQQPFFLFLAAFDQNRSVVPFRAEHFVTGLRYALGDGWTLSAEVYRKNYKDYPVSADLPQLSLANLGDTFNVRQILFPLASTGRGRSQGFEINMEKRGEKWFAQANFGIFRTRHAGLDGVMRPGSFDYPRIFNLTGGYRFNRKWELALRTNYLAGRPYTPYNATLSTGQGRAIFDLSQINAQRLPDYFRFDLRLDRTFYLKDRTLLLFLGVQNITGRRNVAGYQWNRRTNDVLISEQLGVFPLAGFEYRF